MDVVKEYMDVFGVNEKDWIMGEARMEVGEWITQRQRTINDNAPQFK